MGGVLPRADRLGVSEGSSTSHALSMLLLHLPTCYALQVHAFPALWAIRNINLPL